MNVWNFQKHLFKREKESPHLHYVDYDEADENEKMWHSKHPFLSLFFLELSLYKGKKLVVFSVAS